MVIIIITIYATLPEVCKWSGHQELRSEKLSSYQFRTAACRALIPNKGSCLSWRQSGTMATQVWIQICAGNSERPIDAPCFEYIFDLKIMLVSHFSMFNAWFCLVFQAAVPNEVWKLCHFPSSLLLLLLLLICKTELYWLDHSALSIRKFHLFSKHYALEESFFKNIKDI